MSEQDRFQEAVFVLLRDEPFFAHFLTYSRVTWDETTTPTAGVAIIQGAPNLFLNPSFTKTLTLSELVAVLKHEVLHFCLSHVTKKPKNSVDMKLWNVAMDCTINQYISDLPKNTVTLESVSKACEKDLEPFQTSVYYYEALRNSDKLKAQFLKTLDDHDIPGDGTLDEIADGIIRDRMKKAADKAAGNISSELIKAISDALTSKVAWKNVFRNFILKLVSSSTRNTRKKLNRRFGIDAPGKIKERKLKLGVCLDSSGSVGDNEFTQFITEVRAMLSQGIEIVLVDADCKVHSVTNVKSKKDINYERRGNGGTAYQPAIDACMREGVNAIVYFGDMDSADEPTNPGVPFLWAVVGDQDPPGDFGKVLRL
jgi:predicted metal-dependent peptidase